MYYSQNFVTSAAHHVQRSRFDTAALNPGTDITYDF
jgi:hypothetical protein